MNSSKQSTKKEKLSEVIELNFVKNEELVDSLSYLFDQAARGKIKGACYVVKYHQYKHEIGIVGRYVKNPDSALRAVRKLIKTLEKMGDDMECHTESTIEI